MSKPMQTVNLNHLIGFITIYLPEGWELQMSIKNGQTWFSVIDSDGDRVEFTSYKSEVAKTLIGFMNNAREEAGLKAVEYGEIEE